MERTTEDRFNVELIKLLLQAAWSDRELTQAERMVVLGLGRSWSVPEAELQGLLDVLKAGGEMPQPDLRVLRARPDDVLDAARAMVAADGHITQSEKDFLERIKGLLGQDSRHA